ncbi:amidohydrolase family protein [Thermosulfuriphilus sp.]
MGGDELLIKARVILPAWDVPAIFDGAVLVRGPKIIAVGPAREILASHPLARVKDLGASLLFPGLINAHTHAAMTIFRGMADDLPLMRWLEGYIFPAERHLNPRWVYWGTKLAIWEMLASGVTTFADMYIFSKEVIKAADSAGVRAVVGEGLFDFPSPGYGPLEAGLRLTEDLLLAYRDHPRIKVMVCPHALYTCSPETLKKAYHLAEKHGASFNIHLAETNDEVSLIKERYGLSPAKHLASLGLVSEALVAVHGVKLTSEEIVLLAEAQASLVHCPESNLKLASGVAPVLEMLSLKLNVALGTDGPASNNDLDLLGEMRSAALLQKGLKEQATVLPAREAFRMATEAGARALRLQGLGRLEPGFLADMAALDLSRPHLTPLYDPLSLLVYSARGGDVSWVMVNGEVVFDRGVPVMFDGAETRAEVALICQEIKAKLGLNPSGPNPEP